MISAADTEAIRTRPATLPIEAERDQLAVKPLPPEHIRQAAELAVISRSQPGAGKLLMGNLELHRTTQQLRGKDAEVTLTPREYRLLEYVALNQAGFVTSEELLEKAWHGSRSGDSGGLVRTHVLNQRSKQSALTNGEELIQTYPRMGYLLGVSQRGQG